VGVIATRVWSSLQLAPTFSGLAVVLALLVSLPWLPLEPDFPAPAVTSYLGETYSPPVQPDLVTQVLDSLAPPHVSSPAALNDDNFVIHLVATEEEIPGLRLKHPDELRNVIIALPLDDTESFSGFRNAQRDATVAGALPSVKIRDHRCSPMPPSPNLCPLP
jgi:hypothetical protein